jgi:hypothetical protein
VIHALAMSAFIVGKWTCTSRDWPYSRYAFTFSAGGTGTFSLIDRLGRADPRSSGTSFKYSIKDGYLIRSSPTSALTRRRIIVTGQVLELSPSDFWVDDSRWAAVPDDSGFRCLRSRATITPHRS